MLPSGLPSLVYYYLYKQGYGGKPFLLLQRKVVLTLALELRLPLAILAVLVLELAYALLFLNALSITFELEI